MSFAKHETFYIREGWLFKGMAAIKQAEDKGHLPTIFLDTEHQKDRALVIIWYVHFSLYGDQCNS